MSASLCQHLVDFRVTGLQHTLVELGVEHEADLQYLTEEDLQNAGFKLVHKRKLNEIRANLALESAQPTYINQRFGTIVSTCTTLATSLHVERKPTFREQLSHLRIGALEQRLNDLGVEDTVDIAWLSDDDLREQGFRLVERRKLRELEGVHSTYKQNVTNAPTFTSRDLNPNGTTPGSSSGQQYHCAQTDECQQQPSDTVVEMVAYPQFLDQNPSPVMPQSVLSDVPSLHNLYRLRPLGRGAFGCVWLEADPDSGVQVAVKEMVYKTENQRKVGERECEVFQMLYSRPHQFVVRAYAIEPMSSSCRIVMEYCKGGTLQQEVQKQWCLDGSQFSRLRCVACVKPRQARFIPPSSARQWIAQIFLALEYLHLGLHILVRDLKLENVLLNEHNHAKLADFGVGSVQPVSHAPWTFNHPPGTKGYAAPEVLRQEDHDSLADLYSFMILVWMLLTGGVVDDPEDPQPRPPQRYTKGNHKQCSDDFQLFKSYLRYPEKYGVASVPDDAVDLLWGLAQEPELRMGHHHLRQLTLLQEMKIPPCCATPNQIDEWLALHCGKKTCCGSKPSHNRAHHG